MSLENNKILFAIKDILFNNFEVKEFEYNDKDLIEFNFKNYKCEISTCKINDKKMVLRFKNDIKYRSIFINEELQELKEIIFYFILKCLEE